MTRVTYSITIRDLHRVERGTLCADEAVVAIKDGERQIHQEYFTGKCQAPAGFVRRYTGKPGLHAVLLSGSCSMQFEASAPKQDAQGHP